MILSASVRGLVAVVCFCFCFVFFCCCCFGFVKDFFLQGFYKRCHVSVHGLLCLSERLCHRLRGSSCWPLREIDNWTDCVLYFYSVCLQKKNNIWPRSFSASDKTLHSSLLVINPGERKKSASVLSSIQLFFRLNMLISLDWNSANTFTFLLSVESHLLLFWKNKSVFFG